MTSYLLLRNNKESGPYSLNDLVNFGLKPYDLVWVNGKSAAWRYPSEVEELKPYAGATEEQPFDRFFKKVQEPQKEERRTPAPVIVPEPIPVQPAESKYQPQPQQGESPVYIPRKSVFVTLPGQKTVVTQSPASGPKEPVATPAPAYTPAPTVTITENPAAQVKFSQPLDEIKEMYVKTLQDRKNKIARKSFIKIYLRRAAVVAGLVGIGVLAGFIIKPKNGKPQAITQNVPSPAAAVVNSEPKTDTVFIQEPSTTSPVLTTVDDEARAARLLNTPDQHAGGFTPAEKIPANRSNIPAEKKEENTVDKAPAAKEDTKKYDYLSTDKDPVTGERTRMVRTGNEIATPDAGQTSVEKGRPVPAGKSGLESQVSVTSNDYKKVAFGGIRDLRLTVTNRSRYELDNVVVELEYLKPSEQPLRTENIVFKGIAANESSTIRIPDTNRGIKVNYRIISIGSKQGKDSVAER